MHKAYDDYKTDNENVLTFNAWCSERKISSPQFFYWLTVFDLELILLQFLKAQRQADFNLYIESLTKILPWLFALDHIHYSRWLTMHLKDLVNLHEICPTIHEQFLDGKFVTQKTGHNF